MSTVTAIIRDDARLVAAELARELRPLAGTTLLLTGAGGFIGSYLLDVLAAVGREGGGPPCHVVALDNFRVGLPERVQHLAGHPDIEFLSHDVTQPLPLERPVEWLIHAASIASPTFYRRFPLETIDVNVNGIWRLLELARRARAACSTSAAARSTATRPPR